MASLKRDKQILDLIVKTYNFQFELRERLDSKLNNFVAITGTLSSISLAVALFIFERVTIGNPFYLPLVIAFFVFFGCFIAAMIVGLTGYKPTKFTLYPEDTERIIEDYSKLSNELAVIRVVAASFAEAANSNKELNNRKSKICNFVFCLLVVGAVVFIMFAVFMILGLSVPIDP